jgi:hypothetical protein
MNIVGMLWLCSFLYSALFLSDLAMFSYVSVYANVLDKSIGQISGIDPLHNCFHESFVFYSRFIYFWQRKFTVYCPEWKDIFLK